MSAHASTAISCSLKPWALHPLLPRTTASPSRTWLEPQLQELLEGRKPEETRLLPAPPLCLGHTGVSRRGGGCLTGRADARGSLWRACLAHGLFAKPRARGGRDRVGRKLPPGQNDVGDAPTLGQRFPCRTGSTAHPLPGGLDQCKLDAIGWLSWQRSIDPIHEGLEGPACRRRPNTIDFPVVAADAS